jgi:hypothetical protein
MSDTGAAEQLAPPKDAYAWVVHYRDGSTIAQITNGVDDGSWRKVDVRNVAVIRLEPRRDGLPMHGVLVPEGAIAFLTFRRHQGIDPGTGERFSNPAMIVAGWERGSDGAYLYVDHEGNGLISSDRDALKGA